MAKSIRRRGYNAYLRRAKKRFGLTHTQARKMYRLQSAHAGEPINSASLDKHPRLASRFAAQAKTHTRSRATSKKLSVSSKNQPGGARPGGTPAPSKRVETAAPKRIRSVREWEEYYDRADAYEDLILNAGVDTGRGKGKR